VAGGTLVTIFIVGPLFTTLPLRDYFAAGVTWANLDNFSIIVLKTGWVVPGGSSTTAFPSTSARRCGRCRSKCAAI